MAVPQLKLSVKDNIEQHIHDGESFEIKVDCTANGQDVKDADVVVTTPDGGSVTVASGKSDANGIFTTVFTPTAGVFKKYNVVFNATRSPLSAADPITVKVTLEVKEISFFSRDIEYNITVREIREILLSAIKAEIDVDPRFTKAEGASRPPVYMNSFNFDQRDFPQLIVDGGVMIPRRAGIGENNIGFGEHLPDGEGGFYKIRGGFHDMTITLGVIAEDKQTQELLLGAATMALWAKRLMALLHGDINIKKINAGGEAKEPWASKLLYAASVTVDLTTQWMTREKALHTVDKIEGKMHTENTETEFVSQEETEE